MIFLLRDSNNRKEIRNLKMQICDITKQVTTSFYYYEGFILIVKFLFVHSHGGKRLLARVAIRKTIVSCLIMS